MQDGDNHTPGVIEPRASLWRESGTAYAASVAAGAIVVVSLGELLVWSIRGSPGDIGIIGLVTAGLALGAALFSGALTRLASPRIAISTTLTVCLWPFGHWMLTLAGQSGTAARVEAAVAACIVAVGVARLCQRRSAHIALLTAAALCVGATASLYVAKLPPPLLPLSGMHPDIVILVMDTTRRDHLSVYGYPQPTTPALEKLAEHSRVYWDAWSVAPWTSPSHASMFTALLPAEHGVGGRESAPFATDLVTLQGVLRRAGYRTGGFVANPNLHADGWSVDFHDYRAPWFSGSHTITTQLNRRLGGSRATWSLGENSDRVLDLARGWWARSRERPRFLFLNLLEPHTPYRPPEELRRRFMPDVAREDAYAIDQDLKRYVARGSISPHEVSILTGLYDAEIAAMDRRIGQFVDWLAERGELANTLIVVTSDHGERLGERGSPGHLLLMDQHVLRVPLLVHYPPLVPAGRIAERVDLTGLPGLVLELAGIEAPAIMVERSLHRSGSEVIVAQHRDFGWYVERVRAHNPDFDDSRHRGNRVMVVDGGHALTWSPQEAPGRARLYDIENDPHLERDLSRDRPELARRLMALAREAPRYLEEGAPPRDDRPAAPDIQERLRVLGYVE